MDHGFFSKMNVSLISDTAYEEAMKTVNASLVRECSLQRELDAVSTFLRKEN